MGDNIMKIKLETGSETGEIHIMKVHDNEKNKDKYFLMFRSSYVGGLGRTIAKIFPITNEQMQSMSRQLIKHLETVKEVEQ